MVGSLGVVCNRCVGVCSLQSFAMRHSWEGGGGVWERTVGGHAELEIADDRLDNDASVFERDGLDSRTQFFLVLSLLPAHVSHRHASSAAEARHHHALQLPNRRPKGLGKGEGLKSEREREEVAICAADCALHSSTAAQAATMRVLKFAGNQC